MKSPWILNVKHAFIRNFEPAFTIYFSLLGSEINTFSLICWKDALVEHSEKHSIRDHGGYNKYKLAFYCHTLIYHWLHEFEYYIYQELSFSLSPHCFLGAPMRCAWKPLISSCFPFCFVWFQFKRENYKYLALVYKLVSKQNAVCLDDLRLGSLSKSIIFLLLVSWMLGDSYNFEVHVLFFAPRLRPFQVPAILLEWTFCNPHPSWFDIIYYLSVYLSI